MEKLHSTNAYYKGMPLKDIFTISSSEDYRVSLRNCAEEITNKAQFDAYMKNAPTPVYFEEQLKNLLLNKEKVLFLSVGNGYMEYSLMKSFPTKKYWITDITDSMIHVIRDFSPDLKVHPVIADSRNLPFEEGFFDCIIVMAAEYFFDKKNFNKMLLEMKRVLALGGSAALISVSIQEDKNSPKQHLLSFINRSTILSLFVFYLVKQKICILTGYKRTISDFMAASKTAGLWVDSISFTGDGMKKVRRALFRIEKGEPSSKKEGVHISLENNKNGI